VEPIEKKHYFIFMILRINEKYQIKKNCAIKVPKILHCDNVKNSKIFDSSSDYLLDFIEIILQIFL
jgi:hypothetical protein